MTNMRYGAIFIDIFNFPLLSQCSAGHIYKYLPNCGRERHAPSSASLHPDLHLTQRRSSGGHLAQVALLQGGPPGPKGEPHHRSEE